MEEEEDLQPITSEQSTIPAAIASLLQEEDEMDIQAQPELVEMTEQPQQTAPSFQSKQHHASTTTPMFSI